LCLKPLRRSYAVLTAMSSAVLAFAVAVPGHAASAGWREVFTHHYGVATN
jgi:hypothetical protein